MAQRGRQRLPRSNAIWRYCDKCGYRGFVRRNRKRCPKCRGYLLELPLRKSRLEGLGMAWVKLLREALEISRQNRSRR